MDARTPVRLRFTRFRPTGAESTLQYDKAFAIDCEVAHSRLGSREQLVVRPSLPLRVH